MEAATIDAFDEVDRQLLKLVRAAALREPVPTAAPLRIAASPPIAAPLPPIPLRNHIRHLEVIGAERVEPSQVGFTRPAHLKSNLGYARDWEAMAPACHHPDQSPGAGSSRLAREEARSHLIRNYTRHPEVFGRWPNLEGRRPGPFTLRGLRFAKPPQGDGERLHPERVAGVARQTPRAALVAAGLLAAVLVISVIVAASFLPFFHETAPLTGRAAVDAVVARILAAESSGKLGAKAKRSSAAGPAQFIDDTWLELIRAYRPDLAKNYSREELLDLRSKAGLAREIATRFAERNAALLSRRGLPVTAGTLYLAHFAGAAGAAALLSAPDDADAASVMAKADATGKTSREQLVKANPFLDKFTVADIRRWADRKMHGRRLVLTDLVAAGSRVP